MTAQKIGTHDKCHATIERDGRTLICARSTGHLASQDARRRLHRDLDWEKFWFEQLRWEQVEPRRRYRTTVEGRTFDLIHQGRGSVGPDLDVGWYLEGGINGKGHEFMAKLLNEATERATHMIGQRLGEKGLG